MVLLLRTIIKMSFTDLYCILISLTKTDIYYEEDTFPFTSFGSGTIVGFINVYAIEFNWRKEGITHLSTQRYLVIQLQGGVSGNVTVIESDSWMHKIYLIRGINERHDHAVR